MTVTWMRAGSLKSLECILDQKQTSKIKRLTWDFPESPVVETAPPLQGVWVLSLVKKVRAHHKQTSKLGE